METEKLKIIVDSSIKEIKRSVWPDRSKVILGFFIWVIIGTWSAFRLIQFIVTGVDDDLISSAILLFAAAFGLWGNTREWREKSALLATEVRELKSKSIGFDKSGISVEIGAEKEFYSWSEFIRVRETKADFFFYTDSRIRWGIPRRCFESEEQVMRFRSLIEESLGPVAVLRKK